MSLSFDFSDDQNMMRDAIQTFCKEEIAPLVEEAEENKNFPPSFSQKWQKWDFLEFVLKKNTVALDLIR